MLKELENLRLQIRDRDLEIINLQAQVRAMKCCENCKHYGDIGQFSPEYVCHVAKDKCTVEKYESWELKQ